MEVLAEPVASAALVALVSAGILAAAAAVTKGAMEVPAMLPLATVRVRVRAIREVVPALVAVPVALAVVVVVASSAAVAAVALVVVAVVPLVVVVLAAAAHWIPVRANYS